MKENALTGYSSYKGSQQGCSASQNQLFKHPYKPPFFREPHLLPTQLGEISPRVRFHNEPEIPSSLGTRAQMPDEFKEAGPFSMMAEFSGLTTYNHASLSATPVHQVTDPTRNKVQTLSHRLYYSTSMSINRCTWTHGGKAMAQPFLSKASEHHLLLRQHMLFKVFYFYFSAIPCSIWFLVPWLGIKPVPPAVERWSLNHWTVREVPTPGFVKVPRLYSVSKEDPIKFSCSVLVY